MSERETNCIIENEAEFGQVQIADEVVAIIAGLADVYKRQVFRRYNAL